VPAFLPNRDGRRWKIGIGEGADGHGNQIGKAGVLPIERGAAHRAEAISKHVPALGRARPLARLTGNGDLVPAKPRLVADHGAGAALALQAVAHGDARGFPLDGDVQLAAAAGGVTGGHRYRLRDSRMLRTIATNLRSIPNYPVMRRRVCRTWPEPDVGASQRLCDHLLISNL